MYPLLRDLAPVSRTQLAAWEDLASTWAVYCDTDPDTGVQVARCVSCHVGIWRITDEAGNGYRYDATQVKALKVAHLRQAHQDQDPDR